MLDGEISAKAEAAVLKTGEIKAGIDAHREKHVTNNYYADYPGIPLVGYQLVAGIQRAINPEKQAEKESKAALKKLEATLEGMQKIQEAMPCYTTQQAFLIASGFMATEPQAENVFASLNEAEKLLADTGETSYELPDRSSRDALVEGAKSAYTEQERAEWGRIIVEESAGVLYKQSVLDSLQGYEGMGLVEFLDSQIDLREGEERNKFIDAIGALCDYGCLKGMYVKADVSVEGGAQIVCTDNACVTREKYPCYLERVKIDAERPKRYELKDGRLVMHDVELVADGNESGEVSGFQFANSI